MGKGREQSASIPLLSGPQTNEPTGTCPHSHTRYIMRCVQRLLRASWSVVHHGQEGSQRLSQDSKYLRGRKRALAHTARVYDVILVEGGVEGGVSEAPPRPTGCPSSSELS